MKKKNYTYIGIAWLVVILMATSAQAQNTKAQLKDSVEKYETLAYYYADKDSAGLCVKYYDKSRDFNSKIEWIETHRRDSLYKELLLRKYKIKLP